MSGSSWLNNPASAEPTKKSVYLHRRLAEGFVLLPDGTVIPPSLGEETCPYHADLPECKAWKEANELVVDTQTSQPVVIPETVMNLNAQIKTILEEGEEDE